MKFVPYFGIEAHLTVGIVRHELCVVNYSAQPGN
jgi:hypothetical protein